MKKRRSRPAILRPSDDFYAVVFWDEEIVILRDEERPKNGFYRFTAWSRETWERSNEDGWAEDILGMVACDRRNCDTWHFFNLKTFEVKRLDELEILGKAYRVWPAKERYCKNGK